MTAETTETRLQDVWLVLAAQPGLARWLGVSGRLAPGALFESPAANLRGTIIGVEAMESRALVTIQLEHVTADIEFTEIPTPNKANRYTTTICIKSKGAPVAPGLRAEWKRLLSAAVFVLGEHRRRDPRQAVVLIHGIGQQQPGKTLEQFGEAMFTDHLGLAPATSINTHQTPKPENQNVGGPIKPSFWSKPDNLSNSLELRRYQLPKNPTTPKTDLFEFYWADKVSNTTLNQLKNWIVGLMFRFPVPRAFFLLWVLSWLMAIGAAFTVIVLLFGWSSQLADEASQWRDAWDQWKNISALSAAVTAVVGLLTGFLRLSVGDAARYLTSRPENLLVRSTIRHDGLDLLRKLHHSGEYDRVIVVGHSLGSVIGYDLLRLYWAETNDTYRSVLKPHKEALQLYEEALQANPGGDPNGSGGPRPDQQFELWKERRRNGQPWLVTDFITIGSPLTYGSWLLAKSPIDLHAKQIRRELPRCPPQPEANSQTNPKPWKISFGSDYNTGERRAKMPVLNHAALFAVTRWTNVYYKTTALVLGDPVGGPAKPEFGNGITDIAFRHNCHPWTHSRYWRGNGKNAAMVKNRIRSELRLDQLDDLEELRNSLQLEALKESTDVRPS